MQSIAKMFEVHLQELQRLDRESIRKTEEALKRCRKLIKELEAINLEIE